jgi:hypothetical protein
MSEKSPFSEIAGVLKRGRNIALAEIRELRDDRIGGGSGRKVTENQAHRDPGISKARLPMQDMRITLDVVSPIGIHDLKAIIA